MKLTGYRLGIKLLEVALLAVFVMGWGVNGHAASLNKNKTEKTGKTENVREGLPSDLSRSSRQARAARSLNAFALDLYRELAKGDDGNIFFSPQSISSAFAMLFPGSEGETGQEFRRVFHYGDESAADMGALQEALNAAPPEAGTLDAASSIWPAQNLKVYPSYLHLMKRYFDAEITPLDYKADPNRAKDIINKWVKDKTRGKIQNPIDRLDAGTQMVLVSAVYFKANWMKGFNRGNTKKEPFYKADGSETQVDLMNKQDRVSSYCATDNLQAVRMPYIENAYSMLVLLPRKRGDIENLEKSLSFSALEEILQSLKNREVVLFLPKFTVETKYDLRETLETMGLKTSFSDHAQFPKLAEEPLKVDKVIHRAFVDVYEEGTQAAATTSIGMVGLTSVPPSPPVFRADHPFVYCILENRTNAILFMGRYMGP
ncbi:MAG: serpin family protein [Synergistaceae bacterium]|jgi:serpin B|nr:serpin family protein [Synergistaceae bacterium]